MKTFSEIQDAYQSDVLDSEDVRSAADRVLQSPVQAVARRVVVQLVMSTPVPLDALQSMFEALTKPTGAEVRVFEEPQ